MEINSHRTELLKNIDAELLERIKKATKLKEELSIEEQEISRLNEVRSLLSGTTTSTPKTKIRSVDLDFPDYPLDGNTLEKIKYLEDHLGRMWHKKEMGNLLEKAEGNDSESKHLSSKIFYYSSKAKLITMTFGNSKLYSFYTTRPEWIDINSEGNHNIKRGHEPEEALLERLSNEQRKQVTWRGVKYKRI